jgi:hypothetical protein
MRKLSRYKRIRRLYGLGRNQQWVRLAQPSVRLLAGWADLIVPHGRSKLPLRHPLGGARSGNFALVGTSGLHRERAPVIYTSVSDRKHPLPHFSV